MAPPFPILFDSSPFCKPIYNTRSNYPKVSSFYSLYLFIIPFFASEPYLLHILYPLPYNYTLFIFNYPYFLFARISIPILYKPYPKISLFENDFWEYTHFYPHFHKNSFFHIRQSAFSHHMNVQRVVIDSAVPSGSHRYRFFVFKKREKTPRIHNQNGFYTAIDEFYRSYADHRSQDVCYAYNHFTEVEKKYLNILLLREFNQPSNTRNTVSHRFGNNTGPRPY